MMSRTVVFIVCLATALISTYCAPIVCSDDFEMKRIGLDVYCFKVFSFNRHDKQYIDEFFEKPDGEGDNRLCRDYTMHASPNGTSVSIRNKKEYEYVKVLYRTADYSLTSMPLLIGLKYYDERLEWSDKSAFNYSDFMEADFKSRFTYMKKGQCRRFFMYSPPTLGPRKYLVFDIDCKLRFFEFRAVCRYKVPRSELDVQPVPQPDDYSKSKEINENLDYHDYWHEKEMIAAKAMTSNYSKIVLSGR
ncbi:Uncharacterized protein BM_BM9329 [Brugia malayi]|uniref:Bm9329 n=1 Tax=Brugia malayi TaxID=6279 RepID=A0A4E9FH70_BRUMA|nr:Uncharacterized protein BM_BM9329 [Brugia malayi]VIO95842.1 Uncharacterized protein BM_BM9329 [Brugia malayi]